MKWNPPTLVFWCFLLPVPVLSANTVVAYVEAPTLQSSSVVGVSTESFSSFSTGTYTTPKTSTLGVYAASGANKFAIVGADQYGGAKGTGKYFAVGSETGSSAAVTLDLTSEANYFGFWWSAGDANNSVSFLQDGILLATFTTANLVALLPNTNNGKVTAINGATYNTKDYYGNPNNGLDSNEPFAYVDIIANGLQFNQVQFSNNVASSGFESDNHNVAAGVTDPPSGDVIIQNVALTAAAQAPEPGSFELMSLAIGVAGAVSLLRKRKAMAPGGQPAGSATIGTAAQQFRSPFTL